MDKIKQLASILCWIAALIYASFGSELAIFFFLAAMGFTYEPDEKDVEEPTIAELKKDKEFVKLLNYLKKLEREDQ